MPTYNTGLTSFGSRSAHTPSATGTHIPQMGIFMPVYFMHTTSKVNALAVIVAANPSIEWHGIVNFDNGSGRQNTGSSAVTTKNPTAQEQTNTQTLVNAGMTVYGYIFTSYGPVTRPDPCYRKLNDVFQNTAVCDPAYGDDTWYPSIHDDAVNYYNIGVRGIMFDTMENTYDPVTAAYYQSLYDDMKNIGFTKVTGNPGTSTDQGMANTMDIVSIRESNGLPASSVYTGLTLTPRTSLRTDVFNTSIPTQAYLNTISPYIKYAYFTDDVNPNPYDTASTYLDALAQLYKAIP